MNLTQLQAANTKKAKATAANVFARFLEEQSVRMTDVAAAINGDASGSILVSLMDRLGVYLAFQDGKSGAKLAHNTVIQYFRQAKLWLLERFPQGSAHVKAALLKKGNLLERYSKTRPTAAIVKQAPGCTKEDLYSLMRYLYATASTAVEYQDVALLSLLWYVFGRASDLTLLQKQNLSVTAGSVLFLRFVRVKTSQENGLWLFPDLSAITCPVTAIASALVMQTTPSTSLLPHLPAPSRVDIAELGPQVPLADVLAGVTVDFDLLQISPVEEPTGAARTVKKTATIGIHGYVNRVLATIAKPAGVVSALTSHSFRRGGPQAANGCPDLTLQWIADRGGWNMMSTNKAFQSIFNTTQEDQKVAKVLSGWDAKAAVPLVDFGSFDTLTRVKLEAVKAKLFACCSDLQRTEYNVNPAVSDNLCAYLIKAFPEIKRLNTQSPLVRRVEEVLAECKVPYEELLAWAVHLSNIINTTPTSEPMRDTREMELMKAQSTFIEELLDVTKELSARLKSVEADLSGATRKRKVGEQDLHEDMDEPMPVKKARKSASTNLVDAWYEWFACAAHSSAEIDCKRKSDMRHAVGFMVLFAGDYQLDDSSDVFRDVVLESGRQAASAVEAFFGQRGITARSTGTAIKAFRKLHRAGELDALIIAHEVRERAGLVQKPSPASARANLQPVRRV